MSMQIAASGIQDGLNRMASASFNLSIWATVPAPSDDIPADSPRAHEPIWLSDVVSESLPNRQGVASRLVSRESVFGPDLVTESLSLLLAQHAVTANARAFATASASFGTLIDMTSEATDRR